MTGCCWFEFFLISALKSACPLFCLAKHSKRLTHDSGTVLLLGMVPVAFSSGWTIIKVSLEKGEF